jgi:hypothetical protein
MSPRSALFPEPGQEETVRGSVARSRGFLLQQAATRTPFRAARLVADDPTLDRHSAGRWAGRFSLPAEAVTVPDSPVLIRGPLHFPIVAHRPVTFHGTVDLPFVSLEGISTSWASYVVLGSVEGVRQFAAKVQANGSFKASLVSPPAGQWSFQLVAYVSPADAEADRNRVTVGHPWREAERPGDVRDYYASAWREAAPVFTAVALSESQGRSVITGALGPFADGSPGNHAILVTSESDIEYAWAVEPVTTGAFRIERARPFGGRIKLRLVELERSCARRVVGPVWAEENAAAGASAWPDLRIEYRSIGAHIPAQPTTVVPARRDGRWEIALQPPGIGRVSLVDVGSKRVLGEHTMPSGLLRSFNVPAAEAGQTPDDVYYDGFNDACFLYDQAVALIALLQLGERKGARKLVDALLSVQNADGGFPFANDQSVLDEHDTGFIRVGAVAWVCYALLVADRPAYRAWFPQRTTQAARRCLAFLGSWLNPLGLVNGGKGRYVGHVLEPHYVVPWWSTEHNIDTWWCFDLAAALYGEPAHRRIADGIRSGLESHAWNAQAGIFWQGGTYANGRSVPDGQHALDVMSWGSVVLERWGRRGDMRAALERMHRLYYVTDASSGLSGFTTFVPADGYPVGTVTSPWYEGSFGAAFALRNHDPARANGLIATLAAAQNADGSYPYALRNDPLNDIHAFPSLIAAAWNVLAYSGPGTPYPRILWA